MKHILVALMILSLLIAKTPSYASATPLAAQGTQASGSAANNSDDDYISLRWMVYMMILSLPFAPSETHYDPIQIPVNLPKFRLPEPKLSTPSIPKVKVQPLNIPKLKPFKHE